MALQLGVIAEDDSDIEVVKILINKYRRPRSIKIVPIAPGGCSRIRAKCHGWAVNLADRGCTRLILLHDSDNNDPPKLRQELLVAISPLPIKLSVIIIPVREIEAWLLSDSDAVKATFGVKTKMPRIPNPETLKRPKEFLRDLVWKLSPNRTRYINKIHNQKIAANCDISKLSKSPSYKLFDDFIRAHC